MKKQLLLLSGLFLATLTVSAQSNTWHEVESCTTLSVTSISSTFVASVTNPNTTPPNTSANVSSFTKGTARIALVNPIMDTAGQSISLELLADVAGGNGVGSGLFQVQLQSLNPVTTTFLGNLTITAGDAWELKTLSLDGKPNADNGYEYLYINSGANNDAGATDGIIYFDKLKGSLSQEIQTSTLAATPTLTTGNAWLYNHGTSALGATPNFSTDSGGSMETNVTNPYTSDNASTNVLKITRGDANFESVLFDLPGSIDPTSGETVKLRVYTVYDQCDNAANMKFSLKSTEATDTNGNMGQKVSSVLVTIPSGKWTEVEANLSTFAAGQQSTEYASYDRLNVYLNFADGTPAPSVGSIFYIDALQAPASAALSAADAVLNPPLKLFPNPVNTAFVLSQEVDSATFYDLMGRTVKQINSKQTQFDVSDLAKGLYLMDVMRNNKKQTLRFIKK